MTRELDSAHFINLRQTPWLCWAPALISAGRQGYAILIWEPSVCIEYAQVSCTFITFHPPHECLMSSSISCNCLWFPWKINGFLRHGFLFCVTCFVLWHGFFPPWSGIMPFNNLLKDSLDLFCKPWANNVWFIFIYMNFNIGGGWTGPGLPLGSNVSPVCRTNCGIWWLSSRAVPHC